MRAGERDVRRGPHNRSLDTVKKSVADGKAVLVDVRETDEWKDGHLKDAKHLALSDLKRASRSMI